MLLVLLLPGSLRRVSIKHSRSHALWSSLPGLALHLAAEGPSLAAEKGAPAS